ncbi:hypothetical protein CesoFtcFv8_027701 [Champsocephalus esox]|uniref:Uncharacterized protein n=1 Tax=Champsocephalus esox TaxID=159716 RepID=A0AAN7YCL7_9TELE|nr:hypothetical protein CesoFtcFv8_027701 [Champsocephalus esox]
MPVGSPGASGVVGIAGVGGLCVHGDAVPSRQRSLVRGAVELQAVSGLIRRLTGGGQRSAVRLESDPGGARCGNINLEGETERKSEFKM